MYNETAEALEISTHTLTWSVTDICKDKSSMTENFNSHAHVERDVATNMVYYRYSNFNSHAHVERDILIVMILLSV